MFDRASTSYHDMQELDAESIKRFTDEFSAKYLRSCFNPDFLMRVRERNKPVVVEHSCGIRSGARTFANKNGVL